MYLSIIIPAYNEAERIPETLRAVDQYMKTKNWEYEIIVVNDGSKDATGEVVESMRGEISHLYFLNLEVNKGKGHAVQQGMLASNGDLCLFMDADHSTNISELEKMIGAINEGNDIAVSSRHLPDSVITVKQPPLRVFLGHMFRVFVGMIVPLGIRDTQNGFKLFTRWAAFTIFSQQRVYRWAFDVEVLAIAKKLGFSIKEVPIVWKNDDRSQMNLKGMINMLFEVLTVRKNLLTGHYYRPVNIPSLNYRTQTRA